MEELREYAKVSLARYEEKLEKIKNLEIRVLELEHHIENMERMLQRACDYAQYDWVTIDIKDIKNVMEIKEEEEKDE